MAYNILIMSSYPGFLAYEGFQRYALELGARSPKYLAFGHGMLLQVLGSLIVGFIVGAVAKLIVPGKEPSGCLFTLLLGIAGSFVAFWIGEYIFRFPMDREHWLQPAGFFSSLAGAILILVVYHLIQRRRNPPR